MSNQDLTNLNSIVEDEIIYYIALILSKFLTYCKLKK